MPGRYAQYHQQGVYRAATAGAWGHAPFTLGAAVSSIRSRAALVRNSVRQLARRLTTSESADFQGSVGDTRQLLRCGPATPGFASVAAVSASERTGWSLVEPTEPVQWSSSWEISLSRVGGPLVARWPPGGAQLPGEAALSSAVPGNSGRRLQLPGPGPVMRTWRLTVVSRSTAPSRWQAASSLWAV